MIEHPYAVNPDVLQNKVQEIHEREERGSNREGGDILWYKLDKMNVLRILPPWDAKGRFYMEVYKHYNLGQYNHTCVQKTFPDQGIPCPICAAVKHLTERGYDRKQIGQYRPRYASYTNVVVRGQEQLGVQICRMPRVVIDPVILWQFSAEVGPLVDVNRGIDLVITKSGTGLDTKYATTTSPNGRTPLHPDEQVAARLLDGMYKLDQIFRMPNYEALQTILGDAEGLLARFGESTVVLNPIRTLFLSALQPTPTAPVAPPPPPVAAAAVAPPVAPSPAPAATPTAPEMTDEQKLFAEQQKVVEELGLPLMEGRIEEMPHCISHYDAIGAAGFREAFCKKCPWDVVCKSMQTAAAAAASANG